ncbi:MAG TPA: efflux transporter outer membrane subunit [Bryobacteraceae bacterium]|nr:efflux transporter outer membrane subunit [Bryobacteraceae bacterium]
MNRSWSVAVISFLLCSACTVGPKYQRPSAPVAPALKELAGNDQWKMATPSDELLKGKWWEIFGDPELNRLEEMVDISNQNVKQAEAQFRQARTFIDLNHANYYPTIGANPSITQADSGKNAGRLSGTSQSFSLPATVSWEPDLWGRVRLAVEAATADAQVSAADLQNIRLSTQALLATDYFILAGNDMQEAILQNTIEAYRRNLQLTINRYNGGVASKSDVTLAQTQLAGAQAQSTDLRIARAANEHAIAVLTGQAPAELSIAVRKIDGPPPAIPVAVPSLLLERRPDIAAAERLVAAANANIGLAQAAYYPTLSLSATPGLLSTSLANLFTWGSRVWSAGPSVSQTLFDFGRRDASLRGVQAAYDATVASYRQTVLSAFQEVEDDLANLRYLAEEAVQQQEAVVAAEQALDLELARYRAGTDSYINVITTQEITLSDEQAAVSILQRRLLAAVDLVKALGGGWDASALPSQDQMRSVRTGGS